MGILTGDMKRVVDEQKLAGYRFKGRAVIHEPGDAAFAEGIERMRADGSKLTGRVKAIVMIEVRDAAPLVSPAYDDGVMTEADMLETPARPVRAAARTSGPRVAARMELLRTPRLLLRHWEEPDLPAFFDLYSRDDVMRWLGPHPRRALATVDEARERMGRWHDRERALDPPLGLWAIVPVPSGAEPGQPVGTIPLVPLSDANGPTGLVEIGWHLHPRHQGQGFATEAAGAILAAAAKARIGQVLALTDLDNASSQAVAARLGMCDEGTTDRWFGLTSRQFRRHLHDHEDFTAV